MHPILKLMPILINSVHRLIIFTKISNYLSLLFLKIPDKFIYCHLIFSLSIHWWLNRKNKKMLNNRSEEDLSSMTNSEQVCDLIEHMHFKLNFLSQ